MPMPLATRMIFEKAAETWYGDVYGPRTQHERVRVVPLHILTTFERHFRTVKFARSFHRQPCHHVLAI